MDYQGNSRKDKEGKDLPEKKVEKVVTGEVIVHPPSLGSRFKNIFFGGDFHTAAEYVASQVLLPALRNLIVESVSRGADRLIYGDNAPRQPRLGGQSTYQPRVRYDNPINRPSPTPAPGPRWQAQTTKQMRDMTFATKEDAENTIESMVAIVDQYEIVSLADLYGITGQPSTPVDNKWGWTNLATIILHQTRDGWTVTFPPLEEI